MKSGMRVTGLCAGCLALFCTSNLFGQDWPQWLGPDRDGKAASFHAPATWPKELAQKWKVELGDGVSTPALVGDKIYTIDLQEGNEIIRCLDAANGKEIWQNKYEAKAANGPSGQFPGTRSSPIVAGGKVVTLGVRGTLSCLDAATGKEIWRKTDFADTLPRFFTSCSPIVVDGMCIVQLGGEKTGGLVAYDLATGSEKWKWTDDGMAYSSPAVLDLDGTKLIVAITAKKIVAVAAADGKLLWEAPFVVQGRGYNAATPIVNGHTVVYSGFGRGTKAVKFEKQGDGVSAKELWSNSENSVQFNTPIMKNNLVVGITDRDKLFCINAETGKTDWTTDLKGRGRLRGYGSIVDAGNVLLALNPASQLTVFEPTDKEFKEVATYKVGEGETFAYPVLSGDRVFIKDGKSLTLWTIQ